MLMQEKSCRIYNDQLECVTIPLQATFERKDVLLFAMVSFQKL